MNYSKPHILNFKQVGDFDIGFVTIATASDVVPFSVKRVYWTHHTPIDVIRGKHAHKLTEQVMIAAVGTIWVTLENAKGEIVSFQLSNPSEGLYIPPNYWHTMKYSTNALQIIMASTDYDESDYIREKADFINYWNK